MPVAHALEMPVRLTYAAPLYIAVTHTLYVYFTAIGGAFEIGAVACALTLCLLAWRVRRDSSQARAAVLFHFSLLYLALLFVAVAIDAAVR